MVTDAIAQAIAQMEGWGKAGTLASRNNNPGNLTDPRTGQFRIFGTAEEGWNALYSQINLNVSRGLTLEEFFLGKPGVYAGYSSTTSYYPSFVGQQTGLPLDKPLLSFMDGSATLTPASGTLPQGPDWSGLLSEAQSLPGWVIGASAALLVFWWAWG